MLNGGSCLIIGGSGLVGSALVAEGQNFGWIITPVGRSEYQNYVGRRFDLIINANGNASRQRAKRDPLFDLEASVVAVQRSLVDFDCAHYALISTVDVYNQPSRFDKTNEDTEIHLETLDHYGFHKRLAELIVVRQAASWNVFRLAQMVGHGLKKGPIYDLLHGQPLWIHESSELHFMRTRQVARTIFELLAKCRRKEIFNVCGRGSASLRAVIALLPESLRRVTFADRQLQKYHINTDKTNRVCPLPESIDEVKKFFAEQQPC